MVQTDSKGQERRILFIWKDACTKHWPMSWIVWNWSWWANIGEWYSVSKAHRLVQNGHLTDIFFSYLMKRHPSFRTEKNKCMPTSLYCHFITWSKTLSNVYLASSDLLHFDSFSFYEYFCTSISEHRSVQISIRIAHLEIHLLQSWSITLQPQYPPDHNLIHTFLCQHVQSISHFLTVIGTMENFKIIFTSSLNLRRGHLNQRGDY